MNLAAVSAVYKRDLTHTHKSALTLWNFDSRSQKDYDAGYECSCRLAHRFHSWSSIFIFSTIYLIPEVSGRAVIILFADETEVYVVQYHLTWTIHAMLILLVSFFDRFKPKFLFCSSVIIHDILKYRVTSSNLFDFANII